MQGAVQLVHKQGPGRVSPLNCSAPGGAGHLLGQAPPLHPEAVWLLELHTSPTPGACAAQGGAWPLTCICDRGSPRAVALARRLGTCLNPGAGRRGRQGRLLVRVQPWPQLGHEA